jgi:hypothetical protein
MRYELNEKSIYGAFVSRAPRRRGDSISNVWSPPSSHVDTQTSPDSNERKKDKKPQFLDVWRGKRGLLYWHAENIWWDLDKRGYSMWVLLAILGFCTALTSYIFDGLVEQIFDLRRHYFVDNVVMWILWRMVSRLQV